MPTVPCSVAVAVLAEFFDTTTSRLADEVADTDDEVPVNVSSLAVFGMESDSICIALSTVRVADVA